MLKALPKAASEPIKRTMSTMPMSREPSIEASMNFKNWRMGMGFLLSGSKLDVW
ncbi:MAG: hypothetical protein IPI95_06495 [Flavobacteriales bacterium]|nr:hypothetical protein [Flavobacteriales bacterium]